MNAPVTEQMEPRNPARRGVLARGLATALGLGLGAAASQAEPGDLEQIRKRGLVTIAVYNDLPPFHVKGQGIDVLVAQALARELGFKLSLMPFQADEEMSDDLRHMVTRGHYMGFGPADVMLHVPVDTRLMQENPGVLAFAPYYRERVVVARRLAAVPKLEQMSDFGKHRIAVAGQSLAGWLVLGTDNGAYRDQAVTRWSDGVAAAQAMKAGEFDLVAGAASELESVLSKEPGIVIDPLPAPRAPKDGWAIGCAVKKSSTALAQAVQAAMNTLSDKGELQAIFASAGVSWRKV